MSIHIDSLNPIEKQGMVCMFYAMLPDTDQNYKKRFDNWRVMEKQFNRKACKYEDIKNNFTECFKNNELIKCNKASSIILGKEIFEKIYETCKECSITEMEDYAQQIMIEFSLDTADFISMKCGIPEIAHKVLGGEKFITIDGIYTLKEELKKGKIVFFTLGGDSGKASVDWSPGFIGIAEVIKEPYDFGYDGKPKYFKIDMEIKCTFDKPFKREDFLGYVDAYDAAYIGPELSRDPSQAISSLSNVKAVAVIRAVIDKTPELETVFKDIFDRKFMERVLGAVRVMIPVSSEYGETDEELISSIKEEIRLENMKKKDGSEGNRICNGVNILFYGVPGAGKSHRVDEIIKDSDYERVVFHPDYTYSDFVGQIMPRLKRDNSSNEKLTYEFVPGPFTKALKAAESNPGSMFYLIIEEINRGNAPAIFGDIFQLLDRNDDGSGKYRITNFDIAGEVYDDENEKIVMPSNLTILATMNTSDQNIFTLDTAFQRRWDMKYIKNDINGAEHAGIRIGNSEITWSQFANTINKILAESSYELGNSEDKQLGAYFVKEDELSDEKFPEKVLKYLLNDAFRMEPDLIFNENIKSIGDIIEVYGKEGDPIRRIMKKDVYERMMDMSAASPAEATDDTETFESEEAE